jgi:hypothetical protein
MRTEAGGSRVLQAALAALVCLGAACCGPAGFWRSYDSKHIVRSSSDQGPWGGTRWIQWQAERAGTFQPAAAVTFAHDNGWTCEAPQEVTRSVLEQWVMLNKPVFPLIHGDTGAASGDLPRHIDSDAVLVRCETGWVRIDPGTNADSPAFGYILIQVDGTRMAVYHHWGEG